MIVETLNLMGFERDSVQAQATSIARILVT